MPSASFVDDLNADSLDLVELIMSMEEEFTQGRQDARDLRRRRREDRHRPGRRRLPEGSRRRGRRLADRRSQPVTSFSAESPRSVRHGKRGAAFAVRSVALAPLQATPTAWPLTPSPDPRSERYTDRMNVFGVGPLELIVILVVALIFVGPERLPTPRRRPRPHHPRDPQVHRRPRRRVQRSHQGRREGDRGRAWHLEGGHRGHRRRHQAGHRRRSRASART